MLGGVRCGRLVCATGNYGNENPRLSEKSGTGSKVREQHRMRAEKILKTNN